MASGLDSAIAVRAVEPYSPRHCLPDILEYLTIPTDYRSAEGDDVILRRDPHGSRNGRIETQCFSYDHVKVWERGKLVHGGSIALDCQQFSSKLFLDVGRLTEREQTPCCCGA